jgi:hypothetical protein
MADPLNTATVGERVRAVTAFPRSRDERQATYTALAGVPAGNAPITLQHLGSPSDVLIDHYNYVPDPAV